MKDGILRKIVKKAALFCYMGDLYATRYIQKFQGKPRYNLQGFCNGCGLCCEAPMIRTNRIFFHLKSVRWVMLKWHRIVNGFILQKTVPELYAFVFQCTHWDSETKQCDSYSSRPGMCRDYPKNQIYTINPEFFSECSYYALDKNAKNFNKSLERLNLPPEKLEELQKKLYIKE